MPILKVQIVQGRSAQQKQALLTKVSQAVVDSIGAPLPSVRVMLTEIPAENVIVAGELGKDAALVMAMLISGRTEEKKAALIAAVSRAVHESIDISEQDVRVIVRDVPNTDMGMAGGVTAKSAGR
ncbi:MULTISPECIES: 2-hydroxymuconate tautomerase family protein [unclassified Bordetella]|uniref:tautomerase family protein n=1 Tax=unclassified Bordetella TaxID=2630031 RepID=UPI00132929E1|nr:MULTISPECIES: 2-hydroxymuconate tautomerase family protein [unclassified Bordetella]MVW73652.1 2-hydroxymuconate tautomerase family protein [Bordetella sp. 15P40C-2]MVW80238.1 2-hydroxymuconate tautomerase family protein [Bordetella sp. 02P26C-1]